VTASGDAPARYVSVRNAQILWARSAPVAGTQSFWPICRLLQMTPGLRASRASRPACPSGRPYPPAAPIRPQQVLPDTMVWYRVQLTWLGEGDPVPEAGSRVSTSVMVRMTSMLSHQAVCTCFSVVKQDLSSKQRTDSKHARMCQCATCDMPMRLLHILYSAEWACTHTRMVVNTAAWLRTFNHRYAVQGIVLT
jgi:hypothetical protein